MMRDGDVIELLPALERAQKYDSENFNWLVSCKIDFLFVCCRIAIFMSHVPWLGAAMISHPELIPDYKKFIQYAQDRAIRRIKEGSRSKDLFYHLVCVQFFRL